VVFASNTVVYSFSISF